MPPYLDGRAAAGEAAGAAAVSDNEVAAARGGMGEERGETAPPEARGEIAPVIGRGGILLLGRLPSLTARGLMKPSLKEHFGGMPRGRGRARRARPRRIDHRSSVWNSFKVDKFSEMGHYV